MKKQVKIKVVDAICGAGKAQPLYSDVLTKDGFKKMKDIKIGDKVFGEDGNLHNVIGVYPQGKKNIYEVKFQDGTSCRCCDEHLWTYQLPQDRPKNKFRTNTLNEIMNNGIYKEFKDRRVPQIYIPITNPINFEERDVLIDPWLLGVLLGDGHLKEKRSPKISNVEEDILYRISEKINVLEMKLSKVENNDYNIVNNRRGYENKLNKLLIHYNLLNKNSYDKFIPNDYKINSKEIRIEILRGLIDTDGFVDKNENIEFSSSSKQLAFDVKFLVESLGGTARIVSRIPKYKYKEELREGALSYRVYIKQPFGLKFFSSNKHNNKISVKRQRNVYRQIRSVTFIGEEECQCIKVDNPSSLYLTDNFIVTHNTSYAIQEMNFPFGRRYIYVTPYLKEIERVIEATNKDFKEPTNKNSEGSKLEGLRKLVSKGENIVCTHELFKLCDNELLDLIDDMNYTLMLDEVLNVINRINITKDDIDMLCATNRIKKNKENGSITWIDDSYKGKFESLKHLAKNDNLFLFNNTFMFWTLHNKAFEVFKEIYIFTYLFDGQIQRYYYDLHGFEYEKYSVVHNEKEYKLVPYDNRLDNREKIAERLNIYEDKGKSKFNSNFCKKPTKNMFSTRWLNGCDKGTIDRINKNIYSYFRGMNATTKNSFWTTIKDVAPKLKNKKATYYKTGKKSNFVSVNIRATNEYKDCTSCAYIYNRYMNPVEKAFFEFHNVKVDEDTLACSDLIQFLFRGIIRDANSNEKLNVYIPSIRMRKLLYDYLNYKI